MNTILTIEEIINLSFKNTMAVVDAFMSEINNPGYDTWSSKAVQQSLDRLYKTFKKDMEDFMNISSEISDVIARKLAFKNCESVLHGWDMKINRSSWWCSDIRSWLVSFRNNYHSDKRTFISRFKETQDSSKVA